MMPVDIFEFLGHNEKSADDLRKLIGKYGRTRSETLVALATTEHWLGVLLEQAQMHSEVTMADAARVARVERPVAYRLMKGSSA